MYKFLFNYCTERYNKEYRRAMLDLVESNPGAAYLDLGCGDGSLTLKVAEKIRTGNINGIDLVEESCPKVIRVISDLEYPFLFPDGSFDIVTANQIIEHLSNTDLFVKEVYRVLKLGGYAVMTTNNLATLHWIILLIVGKQPPMACISDEIGVEEHNRRMHRRLFTFPGLIKLLEYHKFKVEKVVGSYYFPFPIWLARLLCKIDRNHSHCICIKVRKNV